MSIGINLHYPFQFDIILLLLKSLIDRGFIHIQTIPHLILNSKNEYAGILQGLS